MKIEPMTREDVIKAVERRGPPRIPLVRAKWWGEGLAEQYGGRLQAFDRYPEDVVFLFGDNPVAPRKMNLPWKWNAGAAHDSNCVIDDWGKLDDFIVRLPDPAGDPRFENLAEIAAKAKADDRYTIFGWWTH